jgi:hypothetical protein
MPNRFSSQRLKVLSFLHRPRRRVRCRRRVLDHSVRRRNPPRPGVNMLKVKPFDQYLQVGLPYRNATFRPPLGARAGRVPPVLPTETPVVLEKNVMEGLPVSVVTVANRHWEIVSR